MRDLESDSTLIRRGSEAATFREMVSYAETLEERPLIRLLEELPAVARLSDAKFNLTLHVLRRRFRKELPIDREQLAVLANEVANNIPEPDIARRVRAIFASDAEQRLELRA